MRRLIPTGEATRPVALTEAHQPVPAPGEALIKVEAFAPNRGETFLLEHPEPGLLPGKDIAGLVVQEAADGSGPGIGTAWSDIRRADLSALVRLVEQGRLHPEIGRTADWTEAAATLVDLRERRIRGKAVLLTGGAR
ncbi:zinc-binding dehydrogenase [Streptomyces sp. NPDC015345]|uniref:zinc-binding dehydrogenase n=1 Tax=Streptomyces sp. NPDC015345 TaxID=3364953 RepID=UPI0036FEB50D